MNLIWSKLDRVRIRVVHRGTERGFFPQKLDPDPAKTPDPDPTKTLDPDPAKTLDPDPRP